MEVHMDPSKRKKNTEARRANVIYFLNRNGRIEHPHLIRIHHFCHSGVHLRDVKRWLSELRGKEMPDSFTWSYQRRYKEGFVWQDLVDDDLITPISNCEYVLLGSLHPSSSSSVPADSSAAAAAAAAGESSGDFLPFPEANSSPEKEEPFVDAGVSAAPQPPDNEQFPREKVEDMGKSPAFVPGGRSNSRKASLLLCSLFTCRAVETADAAVCDGKRRVVAGGGVVSAERGSTRPLPRRHGSNLR
ncbi:uncharacterized protein LOC110028851 [Phalaenopsis equestris]|uniref:uncharacterized protein LOC110028851 n=1 Tax=Phalaenopsis equestris TaxID=78828 RepID=UPI0009E19B70|nr:uncharacterized protein LOC110028851 [Phalaenopsis equestris]